MHSKAPSGSLIVWAIRKEGLCLALSVRWNNLDGPCDKLTKWPAAQSGKIKSLYAKFHLAPCPRNKPGSKIETETYNKQCYQLGFKTKEAVVHVPGLYFSCRFPS